MIAHLRAQDIIDPETEAHYNFKTIRPLSESYGHIVTTAHHDHDFYEVFLITYGRIWHLINGQEQVLIAGDLVFMRPADCHGFRQYEQEDCGLLNLAFLDQTIIALFTYLGEGFDPARVHAPLLPPSVHFSETER